MKNSSILCVAISLAIGNVSAQAEFKDGVKSVNQAVKNSPKQTAGMLKSVAGKSEREAGEIRIDDFARMAGDQFAVSNPKLSAMRERAQWVLFQNATHWQAVQEGTRIPWADLREEWPNYQNQVATLNSDLAAVQSETDPARQEALSKALIASLQPIGPYLQTADYRTVRNPLSADQVAELERLDQADAGPARPDPKGKSLSSLSPTDVYTLLDFSVPILIQGPPNTPIILSAGGGGVFENGLSMQEVRTNDEGLAGASWVSHGDSVGSSVLTASSPSCVNEVFYYVNVVELSLLPLPELPTVSAQQVKNLKIPNHIKDTPVPDLPPAGE